jgi:hypothetical protein
MEEGALLWRKFGSNHWCTTALKTPFFALGSWIGTTHKIIYTFCVLLLLFTKSTLL